MIRLSHALDSIIAQKCQTLGDTNTDSHSGKRAWSPAKSNGVKLSRRDTGILQQPVHHG